MGKPKVLEKTKGMEVGEALELLNYHLGLRKIYVRRVRRQLELAKAERNVIREEIEYLEGKKEKKEK